MAKSPADQNAISEIYIDETSQTKHRYLVIGGIILHSPRCAAAEQALHAARQPELPAMEIGWTKVSRSKLEAYRRFVDVFFDNPAHVGPFEFHAVVIDTHKLKDKVFNEGSRETGFNKEIYQLCMKFARVYRTPLFHVYPDSRTTKTRTEDLRLILNRGLKTTGDRRDWPFRRVHFRNSQDWQMLQLVDVLIGALAFRLNRHDQKPDASPAKLELSRHILNRARITDVSQDTAPKGKFTVWHRALR
jgi:hypothetical protein